MKKFSKALILFCVLPFFLKGQEMWGFANSNYAGIMGLELNPASFMGYPYKGEVHVVSGDVMFHNDYLYLPAGRSPLISLATGQGFTQENVFDRFTPPAKNAYANVFLKLPSYAWRNDVWSWNVHVSLRSFTSARDVAFHLAKFFWEGSDYTPLHEIDFKAGPFKAALLTVGEVGVTHSRVLYNFESNYVTGGATVNLLDGMLGVYVHNKNMDYIILNDSTLNIKSITADYAHALPEKGEYSLPNVIKPKGLGVSLSLGMQWFRNRDPLAYKGGVISRTETKKYDWKAGASLLDIGNVKFNNNSETFSFENNSNFWPGFDTTKFYGVAYFDSVMSTRLYGNPATSFREDKFTMLMPGAVSAKFDYSITPRLYANVSVIHPLYLITPAVRRPAQVALTARYERKRWEVAVPVSFYEYESLRVGVGGRIGILVLGSDNVIDLIGLKDSYGLDFYFGIKFPFENAFERRKKNSGKDCPEYK